MNKISLILIIFIFLSSDIFIPLIFSDTYIESINITKILSFSIFFVFLGVVNEHWYVTKNLQKFYALYVSFGALLNIILNYILISNFGLKGAAYATVFTYLIIIFFLDYFNKHTREVLKIKMLSIFKI